ncbi:MAG TPA: MarR family transcriptional regulator [Rubrobacteraceae bacterium]|nr:MarR family transcriptional regulator [Rubrobacteraceae bacterium]
MTDGLVGESTGRFGSNEELGARLVDEFAAFGPAYMRWVKSRLQDGGVSYARMRLLYALRCGGPRIMSSLSGVLGVTPRNVTALVDALEEEGLVVRRPHPTDRRATVIELTDRGVEPTGSMYDEHREAVGELFEGFSGDEQRELLRLLGMLRETLREKGIS